MHNCLNKFYGIVILMSSFNFYCFIVIGVDLSNYALEDLLSFDDIFLDYFNNFLKNSVSNLFL